MKILFLLLSILGLLSCNKVQEEHDPNVFYTCSMDPQIKEKKPGNCPICKMELTRTIVTPNEESKGLKLSETQVRLANIQTRKVNAGTLTQGLTLRGLVRQDARNLEVISSRVPGRIDKLYFKNEGEEIHLGDRVYDIYSEELQSAIQQYLILKEKADQIAGATIDYRTLLKSARTRLLIWGLSEPQVDHLKVSGSSLIPFYSKAKGIVSKVEVAEGDYVNEGAPVLRVADLTSIWIEAEAYPGDIPFIAIGLKTEVVVDAYPNERVEGTVDFISPQLEEGSKVNLVRVTISNKEKKYKSGMRASIKIAGAPLQTLNVPEDAVLTQPTSAVVWIKNGTDHFEPRKVEVGLRTDQGVEVKSGISGSDEVVVSGVYLLNSEFVLRHGANYFDDMDAAKPGSATPSTHQH